VRIFAPASRGDDCHGSDRTQEFNYIAGNNAVTRLQV
jgi:hypothetical protein